MVKRSTLLMRRGFLFLIVLSIQTTRSWLTGLNNLLLLKSMSRHFDIGELDPNIDFASTLPQEEPILWTSKAGLLIDPDDSIYRNDFVDWDSAPIVIPQYKLVFFTVPKVGCTTFKILFRRMMGEKKFMKQSSGTGLPHNPEVNGLKYLFNYTIEEANHMMTSPEYTRAIFVRDPKARFISAYLDKAVGNRGSFLRSKCCKGNANACREARETPMGFLKLIQNCTNSHWKPHSHRMETKYWKYINFVGHLETMNEDGARLLKQIGAEKFLQIGGWGKGADTRIFEVSGRQTHVTNSNSRLNEFYTPELEQEVEKYYAEDYDNDLFGFKKVKADKRS